jgi:hypothetical protein
MDYFVDLESVDEALLNNLPDWCDSRVNTTTDLEAEAIIVDVDYFAFQVWLDGTYLCWEERDMESKGAVDLRAVTSDLNLASVALWKQVKKSVDKFLEEAF